MTRSIATLKKHKISTNCNLSKAKKTHKCRMCHLCFTTEGYMRKHEQQHTNGKPYKCNYCDHGFTQYTAVKKHHNSGICKGNVKAKNFYIELANVNMTIANNVNMSIENNVDMSIANNMNMSIRNNGFINLTDCLN